LSIVWATLLILAIIRHESMVQNKKRIRIRNRVSTGKICPSCQGPKEDRAKVCKTCHDREVDAQVNAPIKTCIDCGLNFPNEEMVHLRCKKCKSKAQSEYMRSLPIEGKEYAKSRNKKWRERNPDYIRRYTIIKRCRESGISNVELILELSEIQKACLICKRTIDICGTLHVDHDHSTGKFRGLICGNCNTLLGHSKDNIETLLEAIEYLKKSRS